MDLKLVKNITDRQIKLLQENDVNSAQTLAMSATADVSNIDGIGDKKAQQLIWNARNALNMSDFIVAADIDENVEYIHTGSTEWDKILGGGVQTGKLTEV